MLRRMRGVLRRFWLTHFRPGYVREQSEKLCGECQRCGACCKIIFHCPFLRDGNHCTVYAGRPKQCRTFPIDERDLCDVPRCALVFGQAEMLEPEPVATESSKSGANRGHNTDFHKVKRHAGQ